MLYLTNWGSAAVNSWEEGKENKTGKASCRFFFEGRLEQGSHHRNLSLYVGKYVS